MSRRLLFLLTLALLASPVGAVEADASLQAIRDQAQAELEAVRSGIAAERSALMQQLQQAQREAEAARQAAVAAAARRDRLAESRRLREREQRREQALTQTLLDRLAIAAGLGQDQRPADALAQVAAAVAALQARIEALPARLAPRLAETRIAARDGSIVEVPVLHLGEARALALGPERATSGVLALSDDGSTWRVQGPAVAPAGSVAGAFPSAIVLDPDATAALRPPRSHRSLAEWIAAGRAWIWPIIIAFVLGVGVSLWRGIALLASRVDPRRLVAVAERLARGDAAAAHDLVGTGDSPLDRVLAAGLQAVERPRAAREAVLEQALLAEAPRLQRGLGLILVMASIAPLLGLLGTVTGMIDMFGVIAVHGSGNAQSLSGAISEALICTQAGMICAIPLLLAHAALARVAERRLMLLEEAACGILGLADHEPTGVDGVQVDSDSQQESLA